MRMIWVIEERGVEDKSPSGDVDDIYVIILLYVKSVGVRHEFVYLAFDRCSVLLWRDLGFNIWTFSRFHFQTYAE
jgi:hypothetical protein